MRPPEHAAQPQQEKRLLRVRNKAASPSLASCVWKPCKQLDEGLTQLLTSGQPLEAFGTWSHTAVLREGGASSTPLLPLTVLHALAGAAGPDIRLCDPAPEDAASSSVFARWHAADLPMGRCIVVRYPNEDKELVLVPLLLKTGGQAPPAPVYWGYSVPANLLTLYASVLAASKLVVVFDIDETLLIANTVDSLQMRLRRLEAARDSQAALLEGGAGEGDSSTKQAAASLAALDQERAQMQQDIELLSFFRNDEQSRGRVRGVDGAPDRFRMPSWEACRNSRGEELVRPVVRLDVNGRPVILTRITPGDRRTSMLFRPRPGWASLRDYMAGLDDLRAIGTRKDRWEVYICTTAEREYALEAWRHLDPQGSLFPLEQLAWRMLCVSSPQKKDLLNVLRKRDIDAAAAAEAVPLLPSDLQIVTDEARASRQPPSGPLPLTVIVDDRVDVWDEASRQAVLKVMPFHAHKEAAALELGPGSVLPAQLQAATDSEAELARVAATLKDMRGKIYQTIDIDIKPEVARLVTTGLSEALQESAASILRDLLLPVPSTPQLLAEAPLPLPASMGAMEGEDRASEVRRAASVGRDSTPPAAAAAAEQPGSSTEAAAAPGAAADAAFRPDAHSAAAGTQQQLALTTAADEEQQQEQQELRSAKKQRKPKSKDANGPDLTSLLQHLQQGQQQQQPGQAPGGGGPAKRPQEADAAATVTAPDAAGALKKARLSGPDELPAAPAVQAPAQPLGWFQQPPPPARQHHQQQKQQQQPLLRGPFTADFVAPVPPEPALALLRQLAGNAPLHSPEAAAAFAQLLPAPLREAAPPQHLWRVLATVLVCSSQGAEAEAAVAAVLGQLPAEQRGFMAAMVVQLQRSAAVKRFMAPIVNRHEVVVPAADGQQPGAARPAAAAPPTAAAVAGGALTGPQLLVGVGAGLAGAPPPPPRRATPPAARATSEPPPQQPQQQPQPPQQQQFQQQQPQQQQQQHGRLLDMRAMGGADRSATPPAAGLPGPGMMFAQQQHHQQQQQQQWGQPGGGQGGQLGLGPQPPAAVSGPPPPQPSSLGRMQVSAQGVLLPGHQAAGLPLQLQQQQLPGSGGQLQMLVASGPPSGGMQQVAVQQMAPLRQVGLVAVPVQSVAGAGGQQQPLLLLQQQQPAAQQQQPRVVLLQQQRPMLVLQQQPVVGLQVQQLSAIPVTAGMAPGTVLVMRPQQQPQQQQQHQVPLQHQQQQPPPPPPRRPQQQQQQQGAQHRLMQQRQQQ